MEQVPVIRWPADRDRRTELARTGTPRLLVVDPDAPPPVSADALEDWIRAPYQELDMRARTEALRIRCERRRTQVPEIDDNGVVRYAGRWASVAPIEASLVSALIGNFRAVVTRDALTVAGWPDGLSSRNVLDVHVLRLRRRLEPIGLAIRTIRARGYLMEPSG